MTAACVIPCLVGCGGTSSESATSQAGSISGAGETTAEFSYWLGTGDPTYYTDYADNPVIRYMTKYMKWGADKNVNISLKYQIPPVGSQSDNLNTMIGTGDYTDIIDGTYYSGSIIDLYNEGVTLDLTDLVKQYMPNYVAWLDAHPTYKKTCMTTVNGEAKYLKIYDFNDSNFQWGGFCYRRDWLVKYGKNPTTQAAFTGGWGTDGKWADDVVFPSKEAYPKTLSDWEWMLGIFKTALASEGITDGYCMSLPYAGYFGTGDVISSFGSNASYYLDADRKTVHFGGEEQGFRDYVNLMSDWYTKGYIDTKFDEHTTDMFYQVDSTKIRTGKVGFFYGTGGSLGNAMDISEGSTTDKTHGICVYGCPQPINDKYGATSSQNITPFNFYKIGLANSYIVITSKAQSKNLPALLSFFDYMYTDEGASLGYFGLNKEEYEKCQDPLYTKNNLTEGAYYWCDSNGDPWVEGTSTGEKLGHYVSNLDPNADLSGAVKNNRCVGRKWGPAKLYNTNPVEMQDGISKWNQYESTFETYIYGIIPSLSGDASKTYSTNNTNLNTFLQQRLPAFIKGTYKSTNDTTWTSFVNSMKKFKTDAVTQVLQTAYDNL
jgi:hypothetical protein